MHRRPNLESLRMFDAAARHLNFRKAADELHITQGAVAQRVRALEDDLGVRLFDRHARGLMLTPEAVTFHQRIAAALVSVDEAIGNLEPDAATIRLSLPPSLAAKWLVPRLAAFSRAHPGIDLQTIATAQLATFGGDGADIAIRQGTPPFGNKLVCERLAPLGLCAVCNPAMADGLSMSPTLGDLSEQNLIEDSHDNWANLFRREGTPGVRPALRINRTALALDAAAMGQGIALAPRLLVEDGVAREDLAVVWDESDDDASGYYVVYPGNRRNQARDAVADWLMSYAQSSRTSDKASQTAA
ncbi:MAG: LysR family transcriptional regulator [Rhodospirillales bacterium]|nr:LysR family transcriptional regulator [Rhodospirillales bacterium]